MPAQVGLHRRLDTRRMYRWKLSNVNLSLYVHLLYLIRNSCERILYSLYACDKSVHVVKNVACLILSLHRDDLMDYNTNF